VVAGKPLDVRIIRPQRGDWTWITRYGNEERKHSGFFARGLTPQRLALAEAGHRPQLSRKGQLALRVLQAAAAGQSIGEIRSAVSTEFGALFTGPAALETEIARILAAHGTS
jgi:protein arginine N-methyltransferase 1/protein arginine N-methyltransferase 6